MEARLLAALATVPENTAVAVSARKVLTPSSSKPGGRALFIPAIITEMMLAPANCSHAAGAQQGGGHGPDEQDAADHRDQAAQAVHAHADHRREVDESLRFARHLAGRAVAARDEQADAGGELPPGEQMQDQALPARGFRLGLPSSGRKWLKEQAEERQGDAGDDAMIMRGRARIGAVDEQTRARRPPRTAAWRASTPGTPVPARATAGAGGRGRRPPRSPPPDPGCIAAR